MILRVNISLSLSLPPEFDSTVAISARVSRQRAWPILSIIPPPSCTLHFSLSRQTACPLILARPWGHAAVRFKLKRQDYVTGYLIRRSGSRRKREREEPQTWLPFRGSFSSKKERWTDDLRVVPSTCSLMFEDT